MKRIAVLGSTGSVGRQTLDIVRSLPDRFKVIALAAGRNVELLLQQAREFRPRFLCCEGTPSPEVRPSVPFDQGQEAVWLPITELASHPDVDLVVVATVGAAGLTPTLAALRAGKVVALANKEVLVIAGHLVTETAARYGGELRPVDSEHSAIWQCTWGEQGKSIERILLTASGGALRDYPLDQLRSITPEEALQHPTWQMGRKVTIDSATLLNKGFEAIEARWFFDVPLERIEVVLHRESIVHSLVEFIDGAVKAQLSLPDMRLPIQCALSYPERLPIPGVERLDLTTIGALHFAPVDFERFPCLALALEAGRRGGTYPTVLSTVDEIAVDAFLAGHISFLQIPQMLEAALEVHNSVPDPTLEEILAADAWARAWADAWIKAVV